MKALILIPLYVAGIMGAAAAVQWTVAQFVPAVHFAAGESAIAILIGITSGVLGAFPLAKSRRDEISGILQLAMVGTVLHLFSQAVLAACAIGFHIVPIHASSLIWLLGGYWVSLIALIGQLRHMILQMVNSVKLQKQ